MRSFLAGSSPMPSDHLFPRPNINSYKAVRGGDLRADQGGLVGRQPDSGLAGGGRGHEGDPGRNAGWAGRTSIPISPMPLCWPRGSTGSSAGWRWSQEFRGDAYLADVRGSRRRCAARWRRSRATRCCGPPGDAVVEHYLHAGRWEQAGSTGASPVGDRARVRAGRRGRDERDHLHHAGRRQRLGEPAGRADPGAMRQKLAAA